MAEETIQHQYIREAPEIEALKLGLIESAKTLTGEDRELTLPEQQIAGFSPLQEAAFQQAQAEGGIGGYQPYLTTGAATLGTGLGTLGTGLGTLGTAAGTLGQAPTAIQAAQAAIPGTAGLFAPSDLSAYMNPYQQSVIDTTMAELNRQGEIARNQLGAQGVGAGAYGGSRFGIQGAELDRNLQDARARALAQLNQQNYGQALQTAQSAYENQQQRQQQQALQQSILDAERGNLQRQMFEPYSRVSYLSDIYKGAPSTQQSLGSMTSPTPPQPSMLQQVGSFGTGLLGTAAAGKQLSNLFG
jgi:hypothetical protein